MPWPKSSITDFYERMNAILKPRGIPLLLGARKFGEGRAAPSICMFPDAGPVTDPYDQRSDLADVDLIFIADCWGRDFNEAPAIFEAFVQALAAQADGPNASTDGSNPGYAYKKISAHWDKTYTTSKDGESVEFRFSVHMVAASREPQGTAAPDKVKLISSTGKPPEIDIT